MSECAGETLVLVATVNSPRESVVNGAFAPERRLALCHWPIAESGSCSLVGETGAPAKGEAAVYARPG